MSVLFLNLESVSQEDEIVQGKKKKFKVWAEIPSKRKAKWSKIWKYQLCHSKKYHSNSLEIQFMVLN